MRMRRALHWSCRRSTDRRNEPMSVRCTDISLRRRTLCSATLAALPGTALYAAVGSRRQAHAAGGRGTLPARLSLAYSLARNGLEIARIEESFEHDGSTYRIVSEARAVGVAALLARGQGWRRESRGTLDPSGLRPEQFTDQRGTGPVLRARLDWNVRRIHFDRPGSGATEGESEPLPASTTDRLSFSYALAWRAGLPAGLPATAWDAPMTDGRRVSHYRFIVAGHEPVSTPAGRFDAIRVSRERERNDPATDVWLAAGRGMIPVRILVAEQDGATFDQVLVQIGGQ
jgi:hypothetical protein